MHDYYASGCQLCVLAFGCLLGTLSRWHTALAARDQLSSRLCSTNAMLPCRSTPVGPFAFCPPVHCNNCYAAQVGVIQPSYGMGDTCRVMWNSGWEGEYDTGRGDRFKLVHVEVSPTSGAPVVGDWTPYTVIERQLGYRMEAFGRPEHLLGPPWGMGTEGGVAVERGTHWTYGGADPGVGAIRRPYSVQEQRELQEKKEQQEARRDVGELVHRRVCLCAPSCMGIN